jgi:squalene synthase HpnC
VPSAAIKLTPISGDGRVIICIKLASHAQIEIMTRDRAGTEAAPAPNQARGLRSAAPAQLASPDGPDRAQVAVGSQDLLAHQAAEENFPVALRLLPRRYRAHLLAVYNFARTVDDIGDEAPPDQRLGLLDDIDTDLTRLYDARQGSDPRSPVVSGLAGVVTDCAIPVQCFRDLIDANRQDQVVTRYETFDELLRYCALSANPVGRIVLYVFGCSTPERAELSDAICSGLQIVEHLQDVAEDLRAGRVYLPASDMRGHDCSERDLAAQVASPQVCRLIAFEADRAAALISAGAPLVGQLRGAARVAVAGYIAGGRAALAAVVRSHYDVLAATPRPTKTRTVLELATVLARGR